MTQLSQEGGIRIFFALEGEWVAVERNEGRG